MQNERGENPDCQPKVGPFVKGQVFSHRESEDGQVVLQSVDGIERAQYTQGTKEIGNNS